MIETGLTISAFEKSLTIIFLSISLSLFPCCSFYVPNRDFWQQDVILHDIFDSKEMERRNGRMALKKVQKGILRKQNSI